MLLHQLKSVLFKRSTINKQYINTKTQVDFNNFKKILKIEGSNYKKEVHYYWLKDNCTCSKCVDISTTQKHHYSGQLDFNLELTKAEVIDNKVRLKWKKDSDSIQEHETIFNLNQIDDHKDILDNYKQKIWKQQRNMEEFIIDYKDYLQNPNVAIKQLYYEGLVILNNVESSQEAMVLKIANKIGPSMSTFYGQHWHVKSKPNPNNIAYTGVKLGYHMDLLYFESPPKIQLLNCLINEAEGGNSLFMDSYTILQQIQQYQQDFEILKQTPITYKYKNEGHDLIYKRPIIQAKKNQLNLFYSPPFMGKTPLLEPNKMETFYKAMKKLDDIIESNKFNLKFRLNKNMCVIFDNRRILHAREAFSSNSGMRHFNGAYISNEIYLDKLRSIINS